MRQEVGRVQTLGRVLAAVLLGGLILFPGVELLRFVVTNVLGLYGEMSLTDCLLVFVIILLCALLLSHRGEWAGEKRERSRKPELTMLGSKPKQRRRPATKERSRSTRSSRR
jgi:hypothetical protein